MASEPEPRRTVSPDSSGGQTASVAGVLAGLRIQVVEVVLHLDRSVFLPLLVTKTVRGLAGHALLENAPEVAGRWFKPGEGNHTPAPYVFQPTWIRDARDARVAFRVFTWDPEAELIHALADVLGARVSGRSFGREGARILGAEVSPVNVCRFSPDPSPAALLPPARLHLITPLCLRTYPPAPKDDSLRREKKPAPRPVGPADLSIGLLVRSIVTRINAVSLAYGNGGQLDDRSLVGAAAMTPVRRMDLQAFRTLRTEPGLDRKGRWIEGVTGTIHLGPCPEELGELFQAASVFHAGRETSLGCGALVLEPEPTAEDRKPRGRGRSSGS